MYARVIRAQSDTANEPLVALFELTEQIRASGVPIIVTDRTGRPTAAANLPFEAPLDDPRVRAFVATLDEQNSPLVDPNVGTIHFGNTLLVRGLRVIPAAQVGLLLLLILAGVYALRVRGAAERERVWAGMARESAHQLGTPLSSLSGWLELLEEHEADPLTSQATRHMAADLERLERVAHRFERIGRPPQRESTDVAQVVERVAAYFTARVPTLAHAVAIKTMVESPPTVIRGDAVLLEWAVEALVKNAIDALAGRGGRVMLKVTGLPEGAVRLIVWDDGPGIPREIRRQIFEAGFSTKQHGWGIGLALTRRIVEDWHGGRLLLVPVERGATFDIILKA
jgi:signal transduction histidine kinase